MVHRFVFIGRVQTPAKSVYARALAGEIPDRLPLNFAAQLASASLTCPDGDVAAMERWRLALQALAQAGVLALDADYKVSPEALSAVLPKMKGNGLELGEALSAWLGPERESVSGAAPKVEDGDCESAGLQPWARAWINDWAPLLRTLGGAESLGRNKLGKLMELDKGNYPLDGLRLKFTATDLLRALEKWRGDTKVGVLPPYKDQTLSKALRQAHPDFSWPDGNAHGEAEREKLIGLLVECYGAGKALDNDGELPPHLQAVGLAA